MSEQKFREFVQAVAASDEVVELRSRGGRSFFFEVRTGEGRSQVVMAHLVESDGEEVVHMMSEIGPADPDLYGDLLRRNLQFRYVRGTLVEQGNEANFALVYAYPFAELSVVEFARAFGELVFMADGIERDFYGTDRS